MASVYFKFESMGGTVFVAEQSDSENLKLSGRVGQDFQTLVDEEDIKTVSMLVKSGFSYWDIETISEEEAKRIIAAEEVLTDEGSDSGRDGADQGTGGTGSEEPGLPGGAP